MEFLGSRLIVMTKLIKMCPDWIEKFKNNQKYIVSDRIRSTFWYKLTISIKMDYFDILINSFDLLINFFDPNLLLESIEIIATIQIRIQILILKSKFMSEFWLYIKNGRFYWKLVQFNRKRRLIAKTTTKIDNFKYKLTVFD